MDIPHRVKRQEQAFLTGEPRRTALKRQYLARLFETSAVAVGKVLQHGQSHRDEEERNMKWFGLGLGPGRRSCSPST